MNNLMFNTMKMDEAPAPTGEGGGGGGGAPAPAPAEQPKETPSETPAEKPKEGEQPAAKADDHVQTKPFLGEQPNKDGEQPAEQPKEGEQPKATEEDYLKAAVKDEKLLGDDSRLQLSKDLLKAVIPTAQDLGVSPEALNKLANALAKAQIDDARDQMHSRIEYFEKMKKESIEKYSAKDFAQINAGIDKWFKPNGIMNNVIRNSELGADPEFLALMHHLGAAAKEDGIEGAGSGGGGSSVDPNSIDGLAKMW